MIKNAKKYHPFIPEPRAPIKFRKKTKAVALKISNYEDKNSKRTKHRIFQQNKHQQKKKKKKTF
jgi:hypothetical protein